jgi:hypothetical protein
MSELSFEITIEMHKFYEQRQVTEYNQDMARLAGYKKWKTKKRRD